MHSHTHVWQSLGNTAAAGTGDALGEVGEVRNRLLVEHRTCNPQSENTCLRLTSMLICIQIVLLAVPGDTSTGRLRAAFEDGLRRYALAWIHQAFVSCVGALRAAGSWVLSLAWLRRELQRGPVLRDLHLYGRQSSPRAAAVAAAASTASPDGNAARVASQGPIAADAVEHVKARFANLQAEVLQRQALELLTLVARVQLSSYRA